MINFLQGAKAAPRLQLRYVFDFSVRLQHHQVVLRHDQVDIDHLLAHLARFLTLRGELEFELLLAGKDAALCITQPNKHIVVES